jgi:hypothetical protein
VKPFPFRNRWVVQYPARYSTTGKRQAVYYPTQDDAQADIDRRKCDREEHGKQAVTSEERRWILYARDRLGDLDKLPQVIEHWRRTGPEAITPTTTHGAVEMFLLHHLPQVGARTASDLRSRLGRFEADFPGDLHAINAGQVETWLTGFKKPWTRKSYWKQLSQLFSFAHRHRLIAVNPMERMKAPTTKRGERAVYMPDDLHRMLEWSVAHKDLEMVAYVALSAYAFVRTSEVIRLYSSEETIRHEDLVWRRGHVHIRHDVSKQTRRGDDERFPPIIKALTMAWFPFTRRETGRVVESLHSEFSKKWRTMHSDLGIKPIPNGMRRSCISWTIAADHDVGVFQAARYAGSSESVLSKHYVNPSLNPDDAKRWFDVPPMF